MTDIPKPLRAWLEKAEYIEQSPEDWFIYNNGSSEIAVDCRGDGLPTVGVLINNVIQETETGIDDKLNDIRIKVHSFYPKNGAGGGKNVKKEAKSEPAPQPNQWKCGKCGTMNGEILEFCKDCGTARAPEKSLADEAKIDPKVGVKGNLSNPETWEPKPKYQTPDIGSGISTTKEAEVVGPDPAKFSEGPARVRRPDAVLPTQTITPMGCMIKGFVPQLEEIGKIKIGRKGEKRTGSGYQLPEKFDHFEITTVLRDETTGNFFPDPVMQVLGENPRELDIMLLYNDISLNYRTRYNAYKGGKCICAGDGETATTLDDDTVVCNPDACEKFQKKECKLNGILSCILMKASRLGGVYKFRTTSHHTSRAILSSLMFISTLTGGTLAMIPLKMTISPKKVQPKDSPKAQTIYVVNVIFPGTAPELLDTAVKMAEYRRERRIQIQQLEQTARLALAAPESEEESAEVQAEFYPEQEVTK